MANPHLWDEIQNIPVLTTYCLWRIGGNGYKGRWLRKLYSRKNDCIKGYPVGEKKYILVTMFSDSETKFEWL